MEGGYEGKEGVGRERGICVISLMGMGSWTPLIMVTKAVKWVDSDLERITSEVQLSVDDLVTCYLCSNGRRRNCACEL